MCGLVSRLGYTSLINIVAAVASLFSKFNVTISVGPSDVLEIERMSESDVVNGKQFFSFIINMVIHSAMKSAVVLISLFVLVCTSLCC